MLLGITVVRRAPEPTSPRFHCQPGYQPPTASPQLSGGKETTKQHKGTRPNTKQPAQRTPEPRTPNGSARTALNSRHTQQNSFCYIGTLALAVTLLALLCAPPQLTHLHNPGRPPQKRTPAPKNYSSLNTHTMITYLWNKYSNEHFPRPHLHELGEWQGVAAFSLHSCDNPQNLCLSHKMAPHTGPMSAEVLGFEDTSSQPLVLMAASAGCLNYAISNVNLIEPAALYSRVVVLSLLHANVDPRLLEMAAEQMAKWNEVLPKRLELITSIVDAVISALGLQPSAELSASLRKCVYEAKAGSNNWTLTDGTKVSALGSKRTQYRVVSCATQPINKTLPTPLQQPTVAITLPSEQAARALVALSKIERFIMTYSDGAIIPIKRVPTITLQAGPSKAAPNAEGKIPFLSSLHRKEDYEQVRRVPWLARRTHLPTHVLARSLIHFSHTRLGPRSQTSHPSLPDSADLPAPGPHPQMFDNTLLTVVTWATRGRDSAGDPNAAVQALAFELLQSIRDSESNTITKKPGLTMLTVANLHHFDSAQAHQPNSLSPTRCCPTPRFTLPTHTQPHNAAATPTPHCAESSTKEDACGWATDKCRETFGSEIGALLNVRLMPVSATHPAIATTLVNYGIDPDTLHGTLCLAHLASPEVCDEIQRMGGYQLESPSTRLRIVSLQARPDGAISFPAMESQWEKTGLAIEITGDTISQQDVMLWGQRLLDNMKAGFDKIFPTLSDKQRQRAGLHTCDGDVATLSKLDANRTLEFLFVKRGRIYTPLADLQPSEWRADGRVMYRVPDRKIYFLPCDPVSAAAALLCASGGANLYTTYLRPDEGRGRITLAPATSDYQFNQVPGESEELWDQYGAHLGLAIGYAHAGLAGCGVTAQLIGTTAAHAKRAVKVVLNQLTVNDSPAPLKPPGLHVRLGYVGPILTAAAAATADDAMEDEEDLDTLMVSWTDARSNFNSHTWRPLRIGPGDPTPLLCPSRPPNPAKVPHNLTNAPPLSPCPACSSPCPAPSGPAWTTTPKPANKTTHAHSDRWLPHTTQPAPWPPRLGWAIACSFSSCVCGILAAASCIWRIRTDAWRSREERGVWIDRRAAGQKSHGDSQNRFSQHADGHFEQTEGNHLTARALVLIAWGMNCIWSAAIRLPGLRRMRATPSHNEWTSYRNAWSNWQSDTSAVEGSVRHSVQQEHYCCRASAQVNYWPTGAHPRCNCLEHHAVARQACWNTGAKPWRPDAECGQLQSGTHSKRTRATGTSGWTKQMWWQTYTVADQNCKQSVMPNLWPNNPIVPPRSTLQPKPSVPSDARMAPTRVAKGMPHAHDEQKLYSAGAATRTAPTPAPTHRHPPSRIYFEQQQHSFCWIHAINHLLGCAAISPYRVLTYAEQMLHQAQGENQPAHTHAWTQAFTPVIGQFSVHAINHYLKYNCYRANQALAIHAHDNIRPDDSPASIARRHKQTEHGFLIFTPGYSSGIYGHVIAIKRHGSSWLILDSADTQPRAIRRTTALDITGKVFTLSARTPDTPPPYIRCA